MERASAAMADIVSTYSQVLLRLHRMHHGAYPPGVCAEQSDMHDTPSEICMFRHVHSLTQMTGSSFLQQQRLHRAQGQKSVPLLSSMHRA